MTEPFTILDYHGRNLPFGSHTPEVILEWVSQLDINGINDWLTAIKLARKFSQKGAAVSELEALEEDSPFVYQFFERQGVRFKVADNTPAYWASAYIKTPDGSQSSFVQFVAKELLKKMKLKPGRLNILMYLNLLWRKLDRRACYALFVVGRCSEFMMI